MDIQNSSVYHTINLLANRPLDQSEKKLIHELTIKKRQSKKQTMSQRQLMARHQLAQELQLERRDAIEIDSMRYAVQNHLLDRSYSSAAASCCSSSSIASSGFESDGPSIQDRLSIGGSFGGADSRLKLGNRLLCSSQSTASNWSNLSTGSLEEGGQYGGQLNKSVSDVSARGQRLHSSGFSASSLPSAPSSMGKCDGQRPVDLNVTTMSSTSDELLGQNMEIGDECENKRLNKELEIRLKKSKLDHLNAELEKRLYQYEYLVSQERALLRNHNMMLFTNKVANNFDES